VARPDQRLPEYPARLHREIRASRQESDRLTHLRQAAARLVKVLVGRNERAISADTAKEV